MSLEKGSSGDNQLSEVRRRRLERFGVQTEDSLPDTNPESWTSTHIPSSQTFARASRYPETCRGLCPHSRLSLFVYTNQWGVRTLMDAKWLVSATVALQGNWWFHLSHELLSVNIDFNVEYTDQSFFAWWLLFYCCLGFVQIPVYLQFICMWPSNRISVFSLLVVSSPFREILTWYIGCHRFTPTVSIVFYVCAGELLLAYEILSQRIFLVN